MSTVPAQNPTGEHSTASEVHIHPTALVETLQVGTGTRVWAHAHVLAGAIVGSDCNLGDQVYVEGGAVVGDRVTIKNQVCVWDGITLEDDVFVGPQVTFTNDRHPRSPRMPEVRERYATSDRWLARTTICKGASLGAAAVILPGIEVGRYAMVAAGSVVTQNVPPLTLVVGAPARPVGWVCRCGMRLPAEPDNATCAACGETPQMRRQEIER